MTKQGEQSGYFAREFRHIISANKIEREQTGNRRLGPRWNAWHELFSPLSPEFLPRACILCLNFRGVLYSFATVVVSE